MGLESTNQNQGVQDFQVLSYEPNVNFHSDPCSIGGCSSEGLPCDHTAEAARDFHSHVNACAHGDTKFYPHMPRIDNGCHDHSNMSTCATGSWGNGSLNQGVVGPRQAGEGGREFCDVHTDMSYSRSCSRSWS